MRHDTSQWTWKPGQFDKAAAVYFSGHTQKFLWVSGFDRIGFRFSENEQDAVFLNASDQKQLDAYAKTAPGNFVNFHPATETTGDQPTMKTEATVQLPAIHTGGTSKTELLDQATYAGDMMRSAIDALGAAAPNARDYYVIGPDAYSRARAQHEDRLKRLTQIRKELEQITEGIADGGHFTQERSQ